jgi:glucosamine 6-phosphate synthetase-like amidotransferase/phosphosugar isomerase protein
MQMATIMRDKVRIRTLEGKEVTPQIHSIAWDPVSAEKGEYRHFMQKEIHEQVRSLTDTLAGRVDFKEGNIRIPQLNLTPEIAKSIKKIYIVACGTAMHAGMVGSHPNFGIMTPLSTREPWYWPSANQERRLTHLQPWKKAEKKGQFCGQ